MTQQIFPLKEEHIISRIFFIREEKVMLDRDLAVLYNVPTKALKQAVKRNAERFPADFMFVLTKQEFNIWRSQIVTSKSDKKGLRYAPMVFTELGVAMLSSVLHSRRAIQMNVAIMRAFVRLRKMLQSNEGLAHKLKELEKETKGKFKEHEEKIRLIFEAIQRLIQQKKEPRKPIGFEIGKR